jgi:hypothetical protein
MNLTPYFQYKTYSKIHIFMGLFEICMKTNFHYYFIYFLIFLFNYGRNMDYKENYSFIIIYLEINVKIFFNLYFPQK